MSRDDRRSRVVTVLFVLGVGGALLTAQEGRREGRGGPPARVVPVHRVAGVRDGVSVFPKVDYAQLKPVKSGEVDFTHYHSYEETASLLKMWAAKYPDLVDLYSAGQSLEGREIWQLTITNKKTGKDTDKPAFFLEGGRHAGEISGIEASLYFVHHVLSGYGTDPALTALVDSKALYVRPNNNPDGNTLYHLTAQTLRSTVRPFDTDGDGLLDEDAGEDLDGDGFIRQMRRYVGPGKGNASKDPKDPQGRAMRRVPQGQGDYETFPEGVDNDLDGRYNEDGIGGLDLHRNYPENWRPMSEATGRGYAQGGAGEFPLSEPETRAVFLFLMTHPNVGLAQSLDTSVPMILRGPSTASSEDGMYPEDAALAAKFDQKGMEITGYPWAGDTYHVYATRGGGNPTTGEPPRDSPIFGHGPDFGYSVLRRHLVRGRNLEWRPLHRLRQGRTRRRGRDPQVARREPSRQGRFPAVDSVQARAARRRGDWRPQPQVLGPEPAGRHDRDLGPEGSDVQPLPRAATRPGEDCLGDGEPLGIGRRRVRGEGRRDQ